MNSRTNSLALASFLVGLITASASAATVTFTLDLTGTPGTFKLTASDSLGDNGGMSSYGIPLTGPILTLDHRTPYAISSANFAPTGFNILRSAYGDPLVIAGQPLTGPAANYLYEIGQKPNSFADLGIPIILGPDSPPDREWLAPIVIANGTYDPTLGKPGFDTASVDLFSNVFESAGNSLPRISAQIVTRVLVIPEPATLILAIAAFVVLPNRPRNMQRVV